MAGVFKGFYNKINILIWKWNIMTLPIGTKAPDFAAKDQNSKLVRLSAFHGRHVILYFYPKDFTPGCTAEACAFQSALKEFRKHKIVVLGISTDNVESHQEFAKKYKLQFQLLADPDRKIAKAYDVLGLMGKILGIAKRVTYIIDKEGMIEEIFTSINPEEHAKDLADIFKARRK